MEAGAEGPEAGSSAAQAIALRCVMRHQAAQYSVHGEDTVRVVRRYSFIQLYGRIRYTDLLYVIDR